MNPEERIKAWVREREYLRARRARSRDPKTRKQLTARMSIIEERIGRAQAESDGQG